MHRGWHHSTRVLDTGGFPAADSARNLVCASHLFGAVDVQRLGRRVGRLTAEEMWSVDDALSVVLGLD